MKRIYRVTVVVEREFERKATVEAKHVRDILTARLGHEADRWHVVSTRISNHAKPERAPARPRDPTDSQVYDSIAKAQALTELREIAVDMAALLGNVKKPRVEWAPNYWCDGGFGYRTDAHSHIGKGARWIRGPRTGRKIPRGLICLNPRAIDRPCSSLSNRDQFPDLIAHELMHVRMPGGSHNRDRFKSAVESLLGRYRTLKEASL